MHKNGLDPASPLGAVDRDLVTDVLVLGGGPAGTWAAWRAASQGAQVVLVDKGYCGSSGATAAGGTGVWYVPPDPLQREAAMASRESMGGYLADREWMRRVLDQTYANMNVMEAWGYPFPLDDQGQPHRYSLQGPEYMRLMRKRIQKAGVKILDHSPALALLVEEGVVGAVGLHRQTGETWRIRAGAVVIATGGCAFLSKALGCNVLTGDGYLMAAEVGAELSGMEFSNAYAISPAFSSVTKTLLYEWATFTYADGRVIEGAGSSRGRSVIARTLLTQPVYACLDKAGPQLWSAMRAAQPNFFLPFDRAKIDPFTQRFPVTLRLEGTVRGTGGIRILNNTCSTTVPGLYAAGDAATRELICGGFTGGGSHNAAWAMSSGYWAGESAARYALQRGSSLHPAVAGEVGLHSEGRGRSPLTTEEVVNAVQAEVFPYDRNLFRTEIGLQQSLFRLHQLWQGVQQDLGGADTDPLKVREAVAMVATARWMYASALARKESRGMHKHQDYPHQDPGQQHRLLCGGLDQVWVKPEGSGVLQEVATL